MEMSIPTKAKMSDSPGDEEGYTEMVTKDISNRGAFFKTRQPFPIASEIRLILDLGKLLVRAVGNVVRVEADGIAVAFTRTEVAAVRM